MKEGMTESLAEALAELQRDLPAIRKTETAKVKTKDGSYSYSFANLAAISAQILPRLAQLGLSFIAKPTFAADRFVLAYSLLHVSGQREDGEYPLPTQGSPQAIGGAITYGRRYCLCAVTGIAPEDDDDDAARATAEHHRPQRTQLPRGVDPQTGEMTQDPAEDSRARELRRMFALLKQAGYVDKEDSLEFINEIIADPERVIVSRSELTTVDVDAVNSALRQRIKDMRNQAQNKPQDDIGLPEGTEEPAPVSPPGGET